MDTAPATRKKEPHPYVRYLMDQTWGYEKWQREEQIPIVRGHAIEDVMALPLTEWSRMGGEGTFINLSDQSVDDGYVCRIAAGGKLTPQKHLFEEVVYVLQGHGSTTLKQGDKKEVQFEWKEGSLFAIPLNVQYQHFNMDGRKDAVILACTSAPLMMDLFRNKNFIFGDPFVFTDRFRGESNDMNGDGTFYDQYRGGLWETNFVPDIKQVALQRVEERGKGLTHVFIALARSLMKVHLAEFEVGTYKKAHRHGPGAHILIIEGQGYSLMWPEGEEPKRYDWKPGSLISPPAGWYHQHFNTGDIPVFHLAFHRPQTVANEGPRDQIEYEDEDPSISRLFESELRGNGLSSRMHEEAK